MFVSVTFDLISDGGKTGVTKVLREYGFKKVLYNNYESFEFPAVKLGSLKKDIQEHLDMDDKLRIYQYPIENEFKISFIEERKWKRLSIKT